MASSMSNADYAKEEEERKLSRKRKCEDAQQEDMKYKEHMAMTKKPCENSSYPYVNPDNFDGGRNLYEDMTRVVLDVPGNLANRFDAAAEA